MEKVKNYFKWAVACYVGIPFFALYILEFAIEYLYYQRIRKDKKYNEYIDFLCELYDCDAESQQIIMEIFNYQCNYLSFKLSKAFLKFCYNLDECH